jgi:hypothetical protein
MPQVQGTLYGQGSKDEARHAKLCCQCRGSGFVVSRRQAAREILQWRSSGSKQRSATSRRRSLLSDGA